VEIPPHAQLSNPRRNEQRKLLKALGGRRQYRKAQRQWREEQRAQHGNQGPHPAQ